MKIYVHLLYNLLEFFLELDMFQLYFLFANICTYIEGLLRVWVIVGWSASKSRLQ